MDGGVKLAFDRPFRQVERVRNLRQLELFEVSHREDQPLPWRQAFDLAAQHVTELSAVRPILGSRRRVGKRVDRIDRLVVHGGRGRERRGTPRVVDAGVHRDPVQPGGELRVLAEAGERTKDLEKHILRNVVSVVMVAAVLERDAIHHRPMTLDQRPEGRSVAGGGAWNQGSVIIHQAEPLRGRIPRHCQLYDG